MSANDFYSGGGKPQGQGQGQGQYYPPPGEYSFLGINASYPSPHSESSALGWVRYAESSVHSGAIPWLIFWFSFPVSED